MKIETKFDLRDLVFIDDDRSVHGRISGIQFRYGRDTLYEVSYMHNGDAKSPWIEEWRLKRGDQE